jgi:putative flippase GtrA
MSASVGRKRRFLGYGALNVLLTNLFLQALLLVVPIGLATLLSQTFNVVLGFFIYGKHVFRVDRLRKRSALSYGLLALVLWWCNWVGISVSVQFGLSRNLAALFLIPILAGLSYIAQKFLVFPQSRSLTVLD